MAKKVLIISTSLRGGSNSEALARECEKGARDAGHEVEFLSLKGKEIRFCLGCLSCQTRNHCVIEDDVKMILEQVRSAEVVVFATPVYFYGMSGQMKTLLDRLNPLYPMEYAFRDIYLIATAAENEEHTFDKAYLGLQGWVDCFGKAELKGIVKGGGINGCGEAASHEGIMLEAYQLGRNL